MPASDSEDETGGISSSSASLPPPLPQSRTMWHYFGKKKDNKNVEKEAEKVTSSSAHLSAESEDGKKRKPPPGTSQEAAAEETPPPQPPPAKKKRTRGKKSDVVSESEQQQPAAEPQTEATEPPKEAPPPKFAIGNFFKKVSKAEYDQQREVQDSVLVVQAEIHAPTEKKTTTLEQPEQLSKSAKKKRVSNVARQKGTEVIEVIEVIEEIVEQVIPAENGILAAEPAVNVIAPPEEKPLAAVDEQAQPEQEVTCIDENPEKISSKVWKRREKNDKKTKRDVANDDESKDFEFFKVKTTNDVAKSTAAEATVEPEKKEEKSISPKLFKQKEKPKKKRKGPKGKKAERAIEEVANNEDSDSIDLDLLSTFDAKSFNCGSENVDEAGDSFTLLMKKPISEGYVKQGKKKREQSSPVSAEPDKQPEKKDDAKPVSAPTSSPSSDKENGPATANNAFMLLMSSGKGKKPVAKEQEAKQTSLERVKEPVAPSTVVEERRSVPKKRGRKKKVSACPDNAAVEAKTCPAVNESGCADKQESATKVPVPVENNAFAKLMRPKTQNSEENKPQNSSDEGDQDIIAPTTMSSKAKRRRRRISSSSPDEVRIVEEVAKKPEASEPLKAHSVPKSINESSTALTAEGESSEVFFAASKEEAKTSESEIKPELEPADSGKGEEERNGSSKEPIEIDDSAKDLSPETLMQSEVSGEGSRRSSRRIKQNRQVLDQKRREQVENERLLDLEINSPAKKKRPRRTSQSCGEKEEGEEKEARQKSKKRKSRRDQAEEEEGDFVVEELGGDDDDDDVKVEKVVVTRPGKPLASIFSLGKKKPPKPAEDPEKVAARKAFLLSSVPNALRTQLLENERESLSNMEMAAFSPFSGVGHVRQSDSADSFWRLEECNLLSALALPGNHSEQPTEILSSSSRSLSSPRPPTPLERNLEIGQFCGLNRADLNASHVRKLSPSSSTKKARKGREGGGGRKGGSATSEVSSAKYAGGCSSQARMSNRQIYHFVKSLKMLNDAFPIYNVFRRFVERKIDSDTLEAVARRKNLSLNEMDVESLLRGGRTLRRRRRHNSKKQKKPNKEETVIKYDPQISSSMQWTMKYAPQSADDVIGNAGEVRKLQSWLHEWNERRKKRAPKRKKANNKRGNKSKHNSFLASSSEEDDDDEDDSSSCFASSDEEGDSCSEESDTNLLNTVLLVGPSGMGKTATVYALATQMGFKVLEVNASSLRGGRQVVAQLQEATQSHHVAKQENGKAGQNVFGKPSKKSASSTKPAINKTALILFEDIDVVFEDQDDGFYGAVINLIATTKRPIILTTSNPNFPAKKFLKMEPQTFNFRRVPARTSAQHLQLLCLAEGFPIQVDSIEALVGRNGGVVSRSILDLQHWCMSGAGGELVLQESSSSNASEEEEGNVLPPQGSKPSIFDDSIDGLEAQTSNGDCSEPMLDKEDLVASLMAIDMTEEPNCSAVRPFDGALHATLKSSDEALSRMENASSIDNWETLPFRKRHFAADERKKAFQPTAESSKYKRIRVFESKLCSAESSDEEDGEGEVKKAVSREEEERKVKPMSIESDRNSVTEVVEGKSSELKKKRKAFANAHAALRELSDCAETTSEFSLATDSEPWWLMERRPAEKSSDEDSLGNEISAFVQHHSLAKASAVIKELDECGDELTVEVCNEEGLASDIPACSVLARSVLNQVVEGLTVSPACHVLDTLPLLRTMARLEATRQAGGGVKKSRSGRFLHYFESQEIYLKPAQIAGLCDTLL